MVDISNIDTTVTFKGFGEPANHIPLTVEIVVNNKTGILGYRTIEQDGCSFVGEYETKCPSINTVILVCLERVKQMYGDFVSWCSDYQPVEQPYQINHCGSSYTVLGVMFLEYGFNGD